MRRAVRHTYFLGFHAKPPSANVYRDDDIQGEGVLNVGAKVDIKPGRAREVTSVQILAVGAKGKLEALKVDRAGNIYQPNEPAPLDVVDTPYKEKLKAKANSAAALRQQHLQEIAGGLEDGELEPPIPPKKICRLPQRLKPADVLALQAKVNSLQCWKMEPGDMPLVNGSPVFVNGATLNYLKGDYRHDPKTLFIKIVDLCLGDLVTDPGLCSTESGAKHRGKVAVPQSISTGAYGYCTLNCPEGTVKFQPTYILRTHLTHARQKSRKTPSTDAAENVEQEEVIEVEQPDNSDGTWLTTLKVQQLPKVQPEYTAQTEETIFPQGMVLGPLPPIATFVATVHPS